MFSKPINRKHALTISDLSIVHRELRSPTSLDDKLFVTMLFTGFHALLRLGEMTQPDKVELRNPAKLTLRLSVQIYSDRFEFLLPAHKADPLFEGNHIVVKGFPGAPDVVARFTEYLLDRDWRFPLHPALWLTEAGRPPTRSWFTSHLRRFFPKEISGHSLRAGGATALAEMRAPPMFIQAAGCWTSEAWTAYVRKHPMLYSGFIFAHSPSPAGPAQ